ncbi:arginine deiminase [Bacillus sp. 1P06AnD]|uniref:arginine deiminase n=1 Tax=Bacillus sp. 1P06AnD TaxID=3132208 RepID=UPI0039A09679
MTTPLHVTSEIGELQTVLLKRPGKELENLTPEYLTRLLFDDIPYLPIVQKEHDYFAQALRDQNIEVLYLEKLMSETLEKEGLRESFIDDILAESKQTTNGSAGTLREYLLTFNNQDLVDKIMAGIRKIEVPETKRKHLHEMMENQYPFYMDPMPNLYFTRDPAATIGNGLTINKMNQPARRRESLFMQYIIKHHPRFAGHDIPVWLDRSNSFSIEGGDELVLNEKAIAVGVSQRTDSRSIEKLALSLFARQEKIERVLAIEIPETRAFMHLDTVFTMVNYDQFTIHPGIQNSDGELNVYIIEKGKEEGELKFTHRRDLKNVLKETLNVSELDLIPCGGGDEIIAAREQWNDGSNTLAIAPGTVVTYDRNNVSNDLLRSHGLKVIEVISSELSRGRGGPRCMSMPLVRKDI